jgi:hypothetical protein
MATQMQINWQSSTDIKSLKLEYTISTDTSFSNSRIVDGEYKVFSRNDNEPFSGTIYVPKESYELYINDDYWKIFGSYRTKPISY